MTVLRVAGMMSGTSADAVDVAVCEFRPGGAPGELLGRLVAYREEPFPSALREHLDRLWGEGSGRLDDLTELNVELGEVFAGAVERVIGEESVTPPDLIASHGQTIYHLAEPGRRRATLQMGEAAAIAARTGITVAADFRAADIAAGGEGAPLVPFFDALVFGGESNRALQNIGGIANVTFLVPGREAHAFDTGPGNAPLDAAARTLSGQPFDRDGQRAAAGRVDEPLLSALLEDSYFHMPPPKSTGRERFGDVFAAGVIAQGKDRGLSPDDIIATLTALTAESIARAYRDFGPPGLEEVILSGGGARNRTLVDMLRARLPHVRMRPMEDVGIPANAKEAMAFALLGHEALVGRPANLPGCTGASRQVILGKIIPGSNYPSLMRKVFGGEREWEPIKVLRWVD